MAENENKTPQQFRYRDMICKVVEITQEQSGDITFQVFLPHDSGAKRYLHECERIPGDLLFRQLVAQYYSLTITNMAPIFSIDEETEKAALFMRCRYATCHSLVGMYQESYDLFKEDTEHGKNVLWEYTFPFNCTGIWSRDENMKADGRFLLSNRVTCTMGYAGLKITPILMEFKVTCVNYDDVFVACENYNARYHHSLYVKICNEVERAMVYVKKEVLGLKSPDELLYKYQVINREPGIPKSCFTLYVVAIPYATCGYEFVVEGYTSVFFNPLRKNVDTLTEKFGFINSDVFNYYVTPLMAHMFSIQDTLYLPRATHIEQRVLNGKRMWAAAFEPHFIPFNPKVIKSTNQALADRYVEGKHEYYLVSQIIHGCQLAFPVLGMNPMYGAICYGRFDSSTLSIEDVASLYTDGKHLMMRILTTIAPYTYFAIIDKNEEEILQDMVSREQGLTIDALPDTLRNIHYSDQYENPKQPYIELATTLMCCINYQDFNEKIYNLPETVAIGYGGAVRYWMACAGLSERPFWDMLLECFNKLFDAQQDNPAWNGKPSMTILINREESDDDEDVEDSDDDIEEIHEPKMQGPCTHSIDDKLPECPESEIVYEGFGKPGGGLLKRIGDFFRGSN